jgi:putative DNA methylase
VIRKKLIEVALPLETINIASAKEKSIRHGHPSTLHLWWARRPLAACRAVLFAQLVDDPSSHPEEFPTDEAQKKERERLFGIIEQLVRWENSNNEQVLAAASAEILKSCDGKPPPVLDPFCGGGSIPLEAQRLGLEAYGSDLNPVAVLITKALIEIPPKFAGRPPMNPEAQKKLAHTGSWKGAEGLAEDVRYYGKWIRDEAEERIGHLYPKVKVTKEIAAGREELKGLVGRELTVVAWLWARTVKCPNPACGFEMPLVRSFWLSSKAGRGAWVKPEPRGKTKSIAFEIRTGKPAASDVAAIAAGSSFLRENGKKVKAMFRCLGCNEGVANGQYIDSEANAGRMNSAALAVVASAQGQRVYLRASDCKTEIGPDAAQSLLQKAAFQERLPKEAAKGTFASNAMGRPYGFRQFSDYFTPRQLVTLTTLVGLVSEARGRVQLDAKATGISDDGLGIEAGGIGSTAYSDAVATYLGMGVSRLVDICNSLCRWESSKTQVRNLFGRQAIPMIWDFAEPNPFAEGAGDYGVSLENLIKALSQVPGRGISHVSQRDIATAVDLPKEVVVSTDPPYYGNIGYAELSDFFYVWLRRALTAVYPGLFSTVLSPKAQELIATPYRFDGDRDAANKFFEEGLGKAFFRMLQVQNSNYPLAVFYAFKQAEADEADEDGDAVGPIVSTGWETMLSGLLRAGFAVTGTWPMRSELSNRPVASGTNALASSVVLSCRQRPDDAPMATRREFLKALKDELPDALRKLQHGSIAPVDLAQAAIGPGMAVFSRYSKVLETDGSAMTVRAALGLINHALDEVLAEQEGEYDAETRWAVAWFEQFGMSEGKYGDAENLARAKDTAVEAMKSAGIVKSGGGKVRLIGREDLDDDWNPTTERRLTIWQVTQYLVHAIEKGGEQTAAEMLRKLGALGESAKDLAYRLYVVAERKKWAQEAFAYNMLVKSWPELTRQASRPSGETARLL